MPLGGPHDAPSQVHELLPRQAGEPITELPVHLAPVQFPFYSPDLFAPAS